MGMSASDKATGGRRTAGPDEYLATSSDMPSTVAMATSARGSALTEMPAVTANATVAVSQAADAWLKGRAADTGKTVLGRNRVAKVRPAVRSVTPLAAASCDA